MEFKQGEPKTKREVEKAFREHIGSGFYVVERKDRVGNPMYLVSYSGSVGFNAKKLLAVADELETLAIDFDVDIGGCPTCGGWQNMDFDVRWP